MIRPGYTHWLDVKLLPGHGAICGSGIFDWHREAGEEREVNCPGCLALLKVQRGTRRILFERSRNTYRIWEWVSCNCDTGCCVGHWKVLCDEPDRTEAEDIASWRQPLVYWGRVYRGRPTAL